MINTARLLENLKNIGDIGREATGGITRLAYSKVYFEALYELKKLVKKKGYAVQQDPVGNLFVTYNPNKSETFIMVGSHLDTVRNGGLYDGALGVFAGLEVLDTIQAENIPLKHGLILAVFNAEEGGEMGGTFGSRAISGAVDFDDPNLAEKLSHYVLTEQDVKASEWDFANIKAFVELHIEQGSYLVDNQYEIGVVEGIVAIYRYDFHLYGTSNHAGTTPMDGRDDPIPKMSKFIQHLYQIAEDYIHPFVMTVGNIAVKPGMYNVIPNEAVVQMEIRDIDAAHLTDFIEKVEAYLLNHVEQYKVVKNVEKATSFMHPEVVQAIEMAADEADYHYVLMSSGAGHDANPISKKVPTGMIFVPSVGGISHSPAEFTSNEQIEKGTNTLLQTVVKLDNDFE